MKKDIIKFIKSAFLFSLIFITIFFILNSIYIIKIEPSTQIFRKDNQWEEYRSQLPNNTLKYAFFGDSHTNNGINPNYINNSFNFGKDGEDYIESYYRIKKIIKNNNTKVNNIVLQIDMHTFSDKIRTKDRLFRDIGYYNNIIGFNEIYKLKNENIIKLYIKSKFRIISNGNNFIYYIINNNDDFNLGWSKRTENYSEQNMSKIAKLRFYTYFNDEPVLITDTTFRYFINIIKLLNNNNINIIFIKYPESKEYNDILKKHIDRDKYYNTVFNKINNITKDYSILDYHDIFLNNSEYFADTSHLNYIGAEILSKIINEDLNNLK